MPHETVLKFICVFNYIKYNLCTLYFVHLMLVKQNLIAISEYKLFVLQYFICAFSYKYNNTYV